MKKLFALLMILTLVISISGMAMAAEYTIKYAHGDPPDPYKGSAHADAVVFKNYVESRTGGDVKVEIYPNCQLGSEREMMEGVKMGTIEMTNISEGAIAGFYQPVLAAGIPYLFSSPPVAWNVLDGKFGDELRADMLDKTGIRCLGLTENGFRNFTNNVRPIQTPEDMKGLEFRTMENPAHMKMVEALGANATPIAWGELYTALQQGVVDGQENPVSLIEVMKFYEVQKYLTMDGHVYSIDFILMNNDFYKKLPDNYKRIVKDAAKVSGLVHRGMQQFNSLTGIKRLKEEGMEVYTPTAEDLQKFREESQPAVAEWVKTKIDPKWVDLLMNQIDKVEAEMSVK